ncbi:MAG: proline--tRNA ligase [Candidatus Omnitrophica bacterium CG1_02_49_16]|nr:MAG: proline--tRNA ligase [Candidatus Omnitrophica bacterium CG1_02_49_16]
MRWTKTLIPTLKENPQEALIKSHRLMLRAGLIRKLASGTYSYLPLGLRALQKAIEIVRSQMNEAGGLEVLLPAIHPAELWKESGRFEILGEDMIHFKDRHGKENVLGPTHEEVITDLVRREIHSYKQLPLTLYQIQTKFRDEMRPRSGIIRSREFIMKDAYSFHASPESLDRTYQSMKEAYQKIFKRCGLEFFIVQADPGAMGGSGSQEFVLFSEAGEDWMVQFGDSDRVVSVEMAHRLVKQRAFPKNGPQGQWKAVPTPGHSSVESVSAYLKKKPSDLLKTMVYQVDRAPFQCRLVKVLVRGDHEVSDYKVRKIFPGAYLASWKVINDQGSAFGFSGPIQCQGIGPLLKNAPLLVDDDVLDMKDFVVGANKKDSHLVDCNLGDIYLENKEREWVIGDFRKVIEGDQGDCQGKAVALKFRTAIELGHIFKLNLRYSAPLKAHYLDSDGKENPMIMGCYGIGVNRILAAAIEQCADNKGIVWPKSISPFQVLVVVIDPKDEGAMKIASQLEDSEELKASGVDILIDDRSESAGVKFNDADLIGIPLRVVLGPKNLKLGKVELKVRKTGEMTLVDIPCLASQILKVLDKIA